MGTKRRSKYVVLTICLSLLITMHVAFGEDNWRNDFDAACAQSDEAMSLTIPELKKQIERCGRLQKFIEAQEETVRKVYLRRLLLCKNLYLFVLEAKMQDQKPN